MIPLNKFSMTMNDPIHHQWDRFENSPPRNATYSPPHTHLLQVVLPYIADVRNMMITPPSPPIPVLYTPLFSASLPPEQNPV